MARRSAQFRDVIITGIPAGEERSFNDAGTIVSCLSADAPFQMAFDDGNFFYVAPGLGYRPFDAAGQVLEFSSLIIRNISAAPIDVHLQVGTGDIIDNRAVYGGTAVPVQPIDFNGPQPVLAALTDPILPRHAVPLSLASLSNLSLAAGVSTLVAPANVDRVAYTVKHEGSARMYLKNSSGLNTHGFVLRPGVTVRFATRGDLYIYNPAAFAQMVRHVEEVW